MNTWAPPRDTSGNLRLEVGERCVIDTMHVAADPLTRALGLMFRRGVPEAYGRGLFFPRCASLHTFHMRFALDIAFLDREGRPLALRHAVPAWRWVKGPRGARHCLEVPAGTLPPDLPMDGWTFSPG